MRILARSSVAKCASFNVQHDYVLQNYFSTLICNPLKLQGRAQGTKKNKVSIFAFSNSFVPINHNQAAELDIFNFWLLWATLILNVQK